MAKLSFEKAMEQLEQIVQELESKDVPLEKALKKFEKGVLLSKYCSELLDETDKKITILLNDPKEDVEEKQIRNGDEMS